MTTAAAVLIAALAASPTPNRFVLHEWGTFTSVAGEDGAPIEWRPLAAPSDLPSFVYNQHRPGERFRARDKGDQSARIRMETPVIYFYVDQPTEVSLKVEFPSGTITEWYPFARQTWGGTRLDDVEERRKLALHPLQPEAGGIDWGKFKVLPNTYPVLPTEPKPSHYYPAREVDAAPVQVCGDDGAVEHEKFLFYRGVGNFALPLQVKLDGPSLRLSGFFGKALIYERAGARVGVRAVDVRGDTGALRPELNGRVEDAREAVLKALLETGLYEKEAKAMVATWKDSWFEDGLRVIYVLPRTTTDELLPLTVTPQPTETVRVLVGRIELLDAQRVAQLRAALLLAWKAGGIRQRAMEDKLHLEQGRFAEPLLTRALAVATHEKERAHLQAVLQKWSSEASGSAAVQ